MVRALSSPNPIAVVDAAVRSVLAAQGAVRGLAFDGHRTEVFGGRLLALRHAEALPAATRTVGVAPGTVVTPLARDLLKSRAIAVRWIGKQDVAQVKHPGEWAFAIEGATESGTIAALRRVLLEDDWSELSGSLPAVARWVAAESVRGALVVTDDASVAVWRACRIAGVRAACPADPDAVARAAGRLGLNLLVVEPAGKSISWMRQLALTLRRGGAPVPPQECELVESEREECRCGSPR
jgi:hypothetical protein